MSWRITKQQFIELFIQQSHLNFNHHEVIPQYAPWAYFILRQQYFIFPEEIFHFPVRENFIGYGGNPFPQYPIFGVRSCGKLCNAMYFCILKDIC